MTQDEARNYLISLLPPGAEDLYDLDPDGDFWLLFDGLAEALKLYGFDLIDTIRREIFPSQAVEKLSDWEAFLGLSKFFVARFGTLAQRQQAVVAKIREKGPFNDQMIQSVVGPLLGYFSTTQAEVLRADKGLLRLAHTYQMAPLTVPSGQERIRSIYVNDGGKVSKAGARLLLEFGSDGPHSFELGLTAPDGSTSKSWITTANRIAMRSLFAPNFAGTRITGPWQIILDNTGGGDLPVIISLFVEGIGPGQDTGGAAWHWGVYVDPDHVGEAGYSDFEAVRAAIKRIKHSHGVGSLILSKEPWPGVTSGEHAAIPGMCVPSSAT